MKVRAISKGFYGDDLKEPGAEFTLSDAKHFSKAWMERVEGGEEPQRKPRGEKPQKGEGGGEEPQR